MVSHIQPIAAFDVDGTLVSGQTQFYLTRYLFQQNLIPFRIAVAVAWWLTKYHLRLPVEQNTIRNNVLSCFRGLTEKSAEQIVANVFEKTIRSQLRTAGINVLQRLESQDIRTVLVSASIEPLIKLIAKDVGASGHVATLLEQNQGCLTGCIRGSIVAGEYKLLSLRQWADSRFPNWELVAAYGDHVTDIPLLTSAQNAFAVCPDRQLRKHAQLVNWQVLDWKN